MYYRYFSRLTSINRSWWNLWDNAHIFSKECMFSTLTKQSEALQWLLYTEWRIHTNLKRNILLWLAVGFPKDKCNNQAYERSTDDECIWVSYDICRNEALNKHKQVCAENDTLAFLYITSLFHHRISCHYLSGSVMLLGRGMVNVGKGG